MARIIDRNCRSSAAIPDYGTAGLADAHDGHQPGSGSDWQKIERRSHGENQSLFQGRIIG